MPRMKNDAAETHNSMESEERVDLDGDNDPEETLEEEVEYKEVEEEEKKNHDKLISLPAHGSEVYLGGIPTDASEEDLKDFCESIGEVIVVRIIRENESGDGKGYAFVMFRNKELATEAIEKLHNCEFRGKRIKCSTTQKKHRLFLGNIPRSWTEANVKRATSRIGPGVLNIDLPKDPQTMGQNRGFAIIEYNNHACAQYSRHKMSNPRFKLDDSAPTVKLAGSRNRNSTALQARALYIKNLPRDITQERLKALFEHHGNITKVVIPPAKPGKEDSRFGFLHYAERTSAMKAIENTERYEIDGHVLDCSLAKPQADQKSPVVQDLQKSQLLPNYPPLLGYGMVAAASGAFHQPFMHAGRPTPGGMAMSPIMLPDGRIGYVLNDKQQPPPRSQGDMSGGERHDEIDRGSSRYNPY